MSLLKLIKWRLPRRLPIGMSNFNIWIAEVIECSGLPANISTRQLAAQFIMHTPPTVRRLSINFIADQLTKAASYQVAQEVVKEVAPTAPILKAVPNEKQSAKPTKIKR